MVGLVIPKELAAAVHLEPQFPPSYFHLHVTMCILTREFESAQKSCEPNMCLGWYMNPNFRVADVNHSLASYSADCLLRKHTVPSS